MKQLILILVAIGLMAGQVSAQAGNITENTKVKLMPSAQAVIKSATNHPELVVITGRIVDAETHQAITDAKINFDKFGEELVNASIDKDGNYALAIKKNEVGEQVRITFKIDGYQRYIAKSVRTDISVVNLNLNLRADESKQASTANMKYALTDDTSGSLVIKY